MAPALLESHSTLVIPTCEAPPPPTVRRAGLHLPRDPKTQEKHLQSSGDLGFSNSAGLGSDLKTRAEGRTQGGSPPHTLPPSPKASSLPLCL